MRKTQNNTVVPTYADRDERCDVVTKLNTLPTLTDAIRVFQARKNADIRALCEQLGVPVNEQPFRQRNIAGFLAKAPTPSGYEIVINANLANERTKNWAIAHELSHWILEVKYPTTNECAVLSFDRFKARPLMYPFNEDTYNTFEIEIRAITLAETGKRIYDFRLVHTFDANDLRGMADERKANFLAGHMLMPARPLIQTLKRRRLSDDEVLSRYPVPLGYARTQLHMLRELIAAAA